MTNIAPAVLIDSKQTWKLLKMGDKDLSKFSYKDVKHKLLIMDEDLNSDQSYSFANPKDWWKTHQHLGTITIMACIPNKK